MPMAETVLSHAVRSVFGCDLRQCSPIEASRTVWPSDLRPTSVLPGRTAQARGFSTFSAIRPTVLPSSHAGGRARTHAPTRTRENGGRTVGRLDGFGGSGGAA